MKINSDYRLDYEIDGIYIQHKEESGLWKDVCPITDTAAEVWEGITRELPESVIIEAIETDFDGASHDAVVADYNSLLAVLKQMNILLED